MCKQITDEKINIYTQNISVDVVHTLQSYISCARPNNQVIDHRSEYRIGVVLPQTYSGDTKSSSASSSSATTTDRTEILLCVLSIQLVFVRRLLFYYLLQQNAEVYCIPYYRLSRNHDTTVWSFYRNNCSTNSYGRQILVSANRTHRTIYHCSKMI